MAELVNKPFSQACENNREPILQVLEPRLRDCRLVLEIGSGTGQHAVYFGAALPHLQWQTSDLPEHHEGIRQWLADYSGDNVLAPLTLDMAVQPWPIEQADAVFSANTCHIAAWEEVLGLLDGCARILQPGGLLILYGPFNEAGEYTSDSNARFDQWLKQQAAHRGIRNRQTVAEAAQARGLRLEETLEMPANNRCLVFRRQEETKHV